jgi:tRNA(fMet)-specific endonuclease VapC
MDTILLDTDVYSAFLRVGDTRADLYRKHVTNKNVALSFISVGELFVWAHSRKWSPARVAMLESRLEEAAIIPYNLDLCRVYGRLRAELPRGRVVNTNDMWIAATAIWQSLSLLTHNRRHFEGIPGLHIISES